MAEWLKAAVLKTVEPQGSVGSNPTSSARLVNAPAMGRFSFSDELQPKGSRIRTDEDGVVKHGSIERTTIGGLAVEHDKATCKQLVPERFGPSRLILLEQPF